MVPNPVEYDAGCWCFRNIEPGDEVDFAANYYMKNTSPVTSKLR